MFTNKKVMGVWSSDVKCIKWMEKSEVIQKHYRENIGWYLSLEIDITSDWYHSKKDGKDQEHIILLVIDITFICFWYALISLLSIK